MVSHFLLVAEWQSQRYSAPRPSGIFLMWIHCICTYLYAPSHPTKLLNEPRSPLVVSPLHGSSGKVRFLARNKAETSQTNPGVWQSFFAGILAHRALTRQTFTILQARTLPVYFAISGILSSFLLAVWTRTNWEEIHSNLTRFGNPAVRQASVLFVVSALSLANWYFIGPKTNGYVTWCPSSCL